MLCFKLPVALTSCPATPFTLSPAPHCKVTSLSADAHKTVYKYDSKLLHNNENAPACLPSAVLAGSATYSSGFLRSRLVRGMTWVLQQQ